MASDGLWPILHPSPCKVGSPTRLTHQDTSRTEHSSGSGPGGSGPGVTWGSAVQGCRRGPVSAANHLSRNECADPPDSESLRYGPGGPHTTLPGLPAHLYRRGTLPEELGKRRSQADRAVKGNIYCAAHGLASDKTARCVASGSEKSKNAYLRGKESLQGGHQNPERS